MTTVLVTGAGGSAAANVIDALRLGDTATRIVGADASAMKLHLSKADERVVIPLARDPRWASEIGAIVTGYGVDVAHAQPDPEVLALGRHRDELPCATFLPRQSTLELASDKVAFAASLARVGAPVPESVGFENAEQMRAAVADQLTRHGTVWIRARVGAGARASLPVRTVEQAVSWIDWWVDEGGSRLTDFMAAEHLPGREFAYQSVWQDGVLIAGQARERVEYLYGHLTPHGQTSTPSVARTVSEPDIDRAAQLAIGAIDDRPHGIYCVDIKQDRAGVAKVTEVNAGRFFTTSNFFAHAGLNMPDLAVRAALGEQLSPIGSSPLEPDLYWIRMVDMGFALVRADEIDNWPRPRL